MRTVELKAGVGAVSSPAALDSGCAGVSTCVCLYYTGGATRPHRRPPSGQPAARPAASASQETFEFYGKASGHGSEAKQLAAFDR